VEFRRKRIRLPAPRYRGRQQFFLTVCCDQRRPFFHNLQLADWLVAELKAQASSSRFILHAWTVMPDHAHILTEGSDDACDLIDFVTRFKRRTAQAIRIAQGVRLWQRRFYDHILRPKDSFLGVAWYIWMNPVRKGICSRPQDYPASGSGTVPWKQLAAPGPEWLPPWKGSA
jgi:REP-associated tyrosine transposase